MWQIITHNLSIIHTQGLFVVTQIAAVNLVTGKMTFAKVWVTSSVCEELFLFNTGSPVCIRAGGEYTLTGSRPRSHKRKRIGGNDVSLSFIHSRMCRHIRLHANKPPPMITFTITKVYSILYPPSLYFGKMSAWRLLLAPRWNRKDVFFWS